MKYRYRKKRLFNYNYQNNFLYIWYKYHFHFFRSLITCGNKLRAFNFFIKLKFNLKQHEKIDPLLIFFLAMSNITPEVLLFPLKMAGIINEVAMPITIRKQIIFATKWVIKLLKDKYRIYKLSTITQLLLSAIRNKGLSIKKKEQVYSEAIRNRYLTKYFK